MDGVQHGSDTQRIVAYHSSMASRSNVDDDDDNDGDSSCNEDENGYGFEDITGVTFPSPSQATRQDRRMVALPVRTVTIRIRCDVMCGAVMDAITTSVERLDGEITKRQGGVSLCTCRRHISSINSCLLHDSYGSLFLLVSASTSDPSG